MELTVTTTDGERTFDDFESIDRDGDTLLVEVAIDGADFATKWHHFEGGRVARLH